MNESAKTLSDSLTRQYNTRNPFRIARMLDITIKYINTKRQKGFCKIIDGYAFIFINQNLSEQMQRMTCAHELSHILLHKDLLEERQYLLEYELFDIQNQTEYEANVFAANLLIDEEELYESMRNGADMVSAASALDVNVNLLMIKLIEMQKEGKELTVPFFPNHQFMGKIRDSADSF